MPVGLQDLDAELGRRHHAAYLVTVRDDGRPHCVAVSLAWSDDELVVQVGSTSTRNARARRDVTLVSPGDPSVGILGAYTLIVDAEATVPSTAARGATLRLRPTHAVLHRPAPAPGGEHGHDCAHVFDLDGSA